MNELSYLRRTDSHDTMEATFGEVAQGMRAGTVKRQEGMRYESP